MVNELYEYTVDKKPTGSYRLARIGMISFYVIFVLAFFLICYITRIIPLFALCPVSLWILVFFTWRYVSIEYQYTVEAGILRLIVIYGGKTKKEKASFHIKEAKGFLRLENAEEKIKVFSPKVKYDFLSSKDTSNSPYVFMIVNNGVKTVALIEAPEPSKKAILFYVTEPVRHGNIID